MSTFEGKMAEIDYISIDCFTGPNLLSYAFFLSHCHSDHMHGLDSRHFEAALQKNNAYLYTSDVSKTILSKMHPFLTPRIRQLDMKGPNFIDIPRLDTRVVVTLIPAGHCPGSVMFLFEEPKRVLYTGDIRIRAKELQKYKELYDNTKTLKVIHNIYLDTTFFRRSFETFPRREESITECCNLINNWLHKHQDNVVSLITPAKYGSEYLFMEIFKRCRMPIHVNQEKYDLYFCFPEMDKVVTLDGSKTRIHCSCSIFNKFNQICQMFNYSRLLKLKPSAMVWKDSDYKDGIVKKTYSNIMSVCYSSHSSYREIVEILKLLKPITITPSVVPTEEKERLEMEVLLEETLKDIHKTETNEESVSLDGFEDFTWLEKKNCAESSSVSQEENCDIFGVLDSPELKRKKMDLITYS